MVNLSEMRFNPVQINRARDRIAVERIEIRAKGLHPAFDGNKAFVIGLHGAAGCSACHIGFNSTQSFGDVGQRVEDQCKQSQYNRDAKTTQHPQHKSREGFA